MKNYGRILFFIFLVNGMHSQDSLKKPFFIKLYSISANGGYWYYSPNEVLKLSDYQTLGKDNFVMQRNPEGYEETYSYYQSSSSSGVYINSGFIFYNQNKKVYTNRYELKLGFNFQQKDEEQMSFRKEERIRFDTLYAFHSNQMYLVDTVKLSGINYSYSKQLYTFNIEFTTHSLQNRILSYYTGLGMAAGWSAANEIKAEYTQNERFKDQNGREYEYEKGPNHALVQRQNTKLANGRLYLAYVPIGGILRFSRTKKGFVKRYALNAELRAGIKSEQLAHKKVVGAFWNLNFGIKIYLNREDIKKSYRPPNPFY